LAGVVVTICELKPRERTAFKVAKFSAYQAGRGRDEDHARRAARRHAYALDEPLDQASTDRSTALGGGGGMQSLVARIRAKAVIDQLWYVESVYRPYEKITDGAREWREDPS